MHGLHGPLQHNEFGEAHAAARFLENRPRMVHDLEVDGIELDCAAWVVLTQRMEYGEVTVRRRACDEISQFTKRVRKTYDAVIGPPAARRGHREGARRR